MGNLMNNTFQDTNENEVKRSIDDLIFKQEVHNQHDRAARFKYLVETFKKMPMKQEGISDSHMSMIHLLLLLSNNPVGQDGYLEEGIHHKVGKKKYRTKAEAEEDMRYNEESRSDRCSLRRQMVFKERMTTMRMRTTTMTLVKMLSLTWMQMSRIKSFKG